MKKKFLAILLAAIMVMMLVPTVAFAETTTPIEAITFSYPSLDSLIGKKFEDVKDTLFTNVQDGDGTELEIVRVFVQPATSLTPLADTDTLQAGAYAMYAIIKAPSGSSFPYTVVTEPTTMALFSGKINGQDNPVMDDIVIMALAQKDGNATSSNIVMSDSMAENDEPATYLALGYNVTLEAPAAPNNKANIIGKIDAADFGYELIIPADTTLDESNYKDGVLLGSGDNAGLVTIEVTKHGADNVDVYYTVDLTNGNLTDGNNHTITTNYGISNAADGTFNTLAANTEYTVYTGGAVKNTYIKVSANETSWNAAPVGDYNATLVFNFDDGETPVTVANILPDNFPTTKDASDWQQEGGSARLFVNAGNAQLYAQSDFPESIDLSTKLTPAGEGVYTCTGNQNETWTFTVENGKFTQVVIAGLTSMQAELNGTYSKAE